MMPTRGGGGGGGGSSDRGGGGGVSPWTSRGLFSAGVWAAEHLLSSLLLRRRELSAVHLARVNASCFITLPV